jgi:site-specific DNA recombinase
MATKPPMEAATGVAARTIDPDEAGIVRRIFKEFASGKSPEAIACDLNREGVAGRGGRLWSNTTLRGQVDLELAS